MSGTSYRLDETCVKVGTEWKYLYRAVDSAGQTVEFMLGARRDVSAAKRFFRKLMRADHRRLPFTIGTDKHASYPEASASSVKEKVLPMYMMRKGQVKRPDGRDAAGQAKFVSSLFGIAA